MNETPITFGLREELMGILTTPLPTPTSAPAAGREAQEPVAFLMFNAGVLPRVGPRRINVKLARAFAERGAISFRFDLAGQGDSRTSVSGRSFAEQALSDIGAAMDHLQASHGISRFALIGICSGAVHAFAVARSDPRVAGVLCFDGHSYRSRWARAMRHWKRFRVASWPQVLAGLLRRTTYAKAAARSAGQVDASVVEPYLSNPSRDEFAGALQNLVDRGTRVSLVYSGSVLEYYSYGNQFRDVFGREPFFDKVHCAYRPDIDHTIVSLRAQRALMEIAMQWSDEVLAA